jgi:hypothetical protein
MFVELPARMENVLVTCPETGRREEIGCLVARDGEPLVVLRCTRFEPAEAVLCAASCVHCGSRQMAGAVAAWRLPASNGTSVTAPRSRAARDEDGDHRRERADDHENERRMRRERRQHRRNVR